MPKDDIDEYFLLIEKLEEIIWALEGSCNDIDCDKYTYKNLLRKKYKPVLEHNFSCMPKLRREKEAAMHLLSLNKFRKFRYKKCGICRGKLDSLGKDFSIVSYTRPISFKGKISYEYKSVQVHQKCKKKVKIPAGFSGF